jgi:hypothetical protein
MADYKELLRKAIAALPENNGASRRAVYEKARSALVGQLRAIQPPLAARDITTHRLQLEDGIRQVEQEASEAVIAQLNQPADADEAPAKTVPKANGHAPAAKPGSIEGIRAADRASTARPKITAKTEPTVVAEPVLKAEPKIEPVKAETRPTPPKPVVVAKNDAKEPTKDEQKPEDKTTKSGRPLPSIVARAEAVKGRGSTTAFGVPSDKPAFDSGRNDNGRRAPSIEPRRSDSGAAAAQRIEPTPIRSSQAAIARQTEPLSFELPVVSAAMSTEREVEVEPVLTADPQGAIDRAIATLDREARGESEPNINGADMEPFRAEPSFDAPAAKPKKSFPDPVRPGKKTRDRVERPERSERSDRSPFVADGAFQDVKPDRDRGGISALTIFLFVFVILLAGVGGAGFWAWREGYIDLDALFAPSAPAVVATDTGTSAGTTPATDTAAVTGPGNTAPATADEAVAANDAPAANDALVVDDRLTASPETPAAAPEVVEPLALAPTTEATPATEERLPSSADAAAQPQTAEEAIAAVNPANIAGSQSLLLEAADDGTANAVPFSGTVEWTKGTDEMGLPTLIGRANIPARNMGVELLIRKNSDPTLPASHLMEINFTVSETFIGGSVAGLPGVLLKNEELVQGSPLIGASARVVGNSFLFALSASPEDSATNNALMTQRKWMDIAIIYATGKRAIITLEKDPAAVTMFDEVFAAWNATASAT